MGAIQPKQSLCRGASSYSRAGGAEQRSGKSKGRGILVPVKVFPCEAKRTAQDSMWHLFFPERTSTTEFRRLALKEIVSEGEREGQKMVGGEKGGDRDL
jgi:hypothetical protein